MLPDVICFARRNNRTLIDLINLKLGLVINLSSHSECNTGSCLTTKQYILIFNNFCIAHYNFNDKTTNQLLRNLASWLLQQHPGKPGDSWKTGWTIYGLFSMRRLDLYSAEGTMISSCHYTERDCTSCRCFNAMSSSAAWSFSKRWMVWPQTYPHTVSTPPQTIF